MSKKLGPVTSLTPSSDWLREVEKLFLNPSLRPLIKNGMLFEPKRKARPDEPVRTGIGAKILFLSGRPQKKIVAHSPPGCPKNFAGYALNNGTKYFPFQGIKAKPVLCSPIIYKQSKSIYNEVGYKNNSRRRGA